MKPDDIARYIIAAIVVLGFGGVSIAVLMAKEVSPSDRSLIIGGLLTGYGGVMGYFFAKRGEQ